MVFTKLGGGNSGSDHHDSRTRMVVMGKPWLRKDDDVVYSLSINDGALNTAMRCSNQQIGSPNVFHCCLVGCKEDTTNSNSGGADGNTAIKVAVVCIIFSGEESVSLILSS